MKNYFVYKEDAPKRPVNLTANQDLLHQAKAAGINLSRTFEEALSIKLRETLERRWLEENTEAINDYNAQVERRGVFAANKRRF